MNRGVAITGLQRDALYQVLLTQLSTFDDLRVAYERAQADTKTAAVLGWNVSDALRLILEGGIGWGDTLGVEIVTLTLPVEELKLILGRVRRTAMLLLNGLHREYEEKLAKLNDVELARDACSELLARLGEEEETA